MGGGKQVFETPLMMFQIHHETIFFGGEIVIYELCSIIVMIVLSKDFSTDKNKKVNLCALLIDVVGALPSL